MADRMETAPDEMLGRVGGAWGFLLFFGLLTLAFGILIIAWPQETVQVVAFLFGLQLAIVGIFRLIGSFAFDKDSSSRVLTVLLSVLAIVVGIACIRNTFTTVAVLGFILGIFWIVAGVIEFVVTVSHDMPSRGWKIAGGILSTLAGLVVVAYPNMSLSLLAWILGIWIAIFGLIEVVAAFQIRKVEKAA